MARVPPQKPRPRPPPEDSPLVSRRFGQEIGDLRASRGLTQEDLAELLGYTLSAVRAWEQGVRLPNWPTFFAICRFCDIAPSQLMLKLDDLSGFTARQAGKVVRRKGAA